MRVDTTLVAKCKAIDATVLPTASDEAKLTQAVQTALAAAAAERDRVNTGLGYEKPAAPVGFGAFGFGGAEGDVLAPMAREKIDELRTMLERLFGMPIDAAMTPASQLVAHFIGNLGGKRRNRAKSFADEPKVTEDDAETMPKVLPKRRATAAEPGKARRSKKAKAGAEVNAELPVALEETSAEGPELHCW